MKKKLALLLLGLSCLNVSASENFSDHEMFCEQQPQISCLDYINQSLQVVSWALRVGMRLNLISLIISTTKWNFRP